MADRPQEKPRVRFIFRIPKLAKDGYVTAGDLQRILEDLVQQFQVFQDFVYQSVGKLEDQRGTDATQDPDDPRPYKNERTGDKVGDFVMWSRSDGTLWVKITTISGGTATTVKKQVTLV